MVSGVSAQVGAQAPPSTSLAASLQRAYAGIKANVMQAAELMPEADYNFKPNPDIRTFGGQLGHIANFHYLFCSGEKGVPNPFVGQDLEKKTAKADIVKALADSYAYCDAAFSSLTDQRALELVAQGRGQLARGGVLSNLIAHDNEEYGILTVYLRLKGLVPPSTAAAAQRGSGRGGQAAQGAGRD
jgi:hypothetical protein